MPHSQDTCYEFGTFRLDVNQRVLTRSGEPVSLTPKATDILVLLLNNAGQLVDKEELIREVWPDSFVEEQNLTQNIFVLRRALGDGTAGAKFIETVPRRGYRFVTAVKKISCGQIQGGSREGTSESSVPPILAVLPFTNATGDPKLDYLAEGLTENIINNLSRTSKLRVISRSAVFRYKGREADPLIIGQGLGVDVVLSGNLYPRSSGFAIRAELVDVKNNWQLWGQSFECELSQLLETQDEITRQISAALKLTLTGEEEKQLTTRHTENSHAYQAYLEGRYHWSKYTKEGIEKAIIHFREAIDLDAKYALAYAGIIDCYLRLATNYFRPEDEVFSQLTRMPSVHMDQHLNLNANDRVKLRHEWDWKGAERELRRANELKSDYLAAHQWYAAYVFAKHLFQSNRRVHHDESQSLVNDVAVTNSTDVDVLPAQIPSANLTEAEQVQVYCAVAREQIDSGNYDAACAVLFQWWSFGERPKVDGLSLQSCADLLFTVGELAGCVASARQIPKGQKHGEGLLSGSIALFELLGSRVRAAEARLELALCYYRQGMFELGRSTLVEVLAELTPREGELRCLALIRLASLERHAGRLRDAVDRLTEATRLLDTAGPWAAGRCHLELASTFKDLGSGEGKPEYFQESMRLYEMALYEFDAIGNYRLSAIAENNLGFLLLLLGNFDQSEVHLAHARVVFDRLSDRVRRAQVDDTLSRLYLAQQKNKMAMEAANRAIATLEAGDEDALLAEAMVTKGLVLCNLERYAEARIALEGANRLAERCGDDEGAGRALLVLVERVGPWLERRELEDFGSRLNNLLAETQQSSTRVRVANCLDWILENTAHE